MKIKDHSNSQKYWREFSELRLNKIEQLRLWLSKINIKLENAFNTHINQEQVNQLK